MPLWSPRRHRLSVGQANRPQAGRGQIKGRRAPQSSQAHDKDPSFFEPPVADISPLHHDSDLLATKAHAQCPYFFTGHGENRSTKLTKKKPLPNCSEETRLQPFLISHGSTALQELAPASRPTTQLLWLPRASPSTTLDKNEGYSFFFRIRRNWCLCQGKIELYLCFFLSPFGGMGLNRSSS